MIVIVAALQQEFAVIREKLTGASVREMDGAHIRLGSLGGKAAALVVSGVGPESAARATRLALQHLSPRVVISIGYAGGLVPDASPGTLILPDRVGVDAASESAANKTPLQFKDANPDVRLLKLAQSAAARIRCRALSGTIVTVPAVAATRQAKKALYARSGAVAVDMESVAVGAVCHEAGVPIVFLRCVTDGVKDEIPRIKAIAAAFRGKLQIVPFLTSLVRHPIAAMALWRLFWRARRASEIMARFVQAFCEDLPDPLPG